MALKEKPALPPQLVARGLTVVAYIHGYTLATIENQCAEQPPYENEWGYPQAMEYPAHLALEQSLMRSIGVDIVVAANRGVQLLPLGTEGLSNERGSR